MKRGAMKLGSAFEFLSKRDRQKYETARELGLLDRVTEVGWAGLSAKESGRIGGKMGRKRMRKRQG
jgi:hypothetical protein